MGGEKDTAAERERQADRARRVAETENEAAAAHPLEDGRRPATTVAGQADNQVAPKPEGRHTSLLQQVPAIVCELDMEGTTLFANDALTKITGYRPADVTGRSWWDLLCPGPLHAQADELSCRLRAGDVTGYEMVVKARDGSLHTLAWDFSREPGNGVTKALVGFGLDITEHKRLDDELQRSVAKLRGALEGTVEAIALTVELRDPYTAGHQRRVATLACAIGEEMGLPEEQLRAIRLAGTIHDIGKISVPAELLTKRGPMTPAELDLLRAHPQVGYAILKMIDFPWPVAQIVHQHHERYNGSGYPLGLAGKDILLEARILAAADVVESMAGPRPYRRALGVDEAIREIVIHRGELYDPVVVDACLTVIKEIEFEWE